MAKHSSYKVWWDEFKSRSKQEDNFVTFIKQNVGKLGLAEAVSCISIGAGCGEIDAALINIAMPKMKYYYGVEPHLDMFQALQETMSHVVEEHSLEAKFIMEGAEEWRGPERPVDVILLLNVMYHVRNIKGFLSRCKSWLNPKGLLFITSVDGEIPHINLAKRIDHERNAEAYENPKILMQASGFQEIFYDRIRNEVDLSEVNSEIASFFFNREASDEDIKHFRHVVEEVSGKNNFMEIYFIHFCVGRNKME